MKFDRYWLDNTAKTYGYEIRDDADIAILLEGITANNGGCPCVPKFAQNENTQCPCKPMRERGRCHCGLFKNKC